MSLIERPWFGRRHATVTDERDPRMPRFDLRPGAVNRFDHDRNFQIPDDMHRELDQALAEAADRAPLGTPAPRPRTAQVIANELEHLRTELANARELVKAGEAKEAQLEAERDKAIDEEIAVKKATLETEVAELEALRPKAGETA